MSATLDTAKHKWLTSGDHYPRREYERAAYKVANEREEPWQRHAIFSTPHGLLLLEWGRYGWDVRWLEDPTPLELPRIGEEP